MGFSERFYTSQDGLSLYFRDYGKEHRVKTPVLCLAGLTRNSNDFSRLAEQLSSDRWVICPDYRGRENQTTTPIGVITLHSIRTISGIYLALLTSVGYS